MSGTEKEGSDWVNRFRLSNDWKKSTFVQL
jgi:hypothetical protein